MVNANDKVVYIPVLKWKQGEQGAVKPLSSAQRAQMLPIAELQDRTYDWKKQIYNKTWEEHLDKMALTTRNAWGKSHEIAVDMNSATMPHLINKARRRHFSVLWAHGVQAVPVVGTYTAPTEVAELREVSDLHDRKRWLLRYVFDQEAEVLPAPQEVASWYKSASKQLGVEHSQIDAVVDLGHVANWDVKALAPDIANIVRAVSELGHWRRVAVLSGAFPRNLAGYNRGTYQIPRIDWALYQEVRTLAKTSQQFPLYGDYGVSHIEAFDGDPRTIKMSVNLRYAHWDTWTVFKARSAIDFGFEQYLELCKLLTALPVFMTAGFSHGDANYEEKATKVGATPGNASNWRRDATNHHLHVVLHQLASLPVI